MPHHISGNAASCMLPFELKKTLFSHVAHSKAHKLEVMWSQSVARASGARDITVSQFIRRFRVKYGAIALHMCTCTAEQRQAESKRHTSELIEFLNQIPSCVTASQKDELISVVVCSSDTNGLEKEDRAAILNAIDGWARRRRNAQTWGERMLDVFTAEEWALTKIHNYPFDRLTFCFLFYASGRTFVGGARVVNGAEKKII